MREFRKGLQSDDENKPAEPPTDDQSPKS